MKQWKVEYESISSGFRERTIRADRVTIVDGQLTFWMNLNPVAWINMVNLVCCLELAQGGAIVAEPRRERRAPRSEEEVFVPYSDRPVMRFDEDPIASAAREAANRMERSHPKTASIELRPGGPVSTTE